MIFKSYSYFYCIVDHCKAVKMLLIYFIVLPLHVKVKTRHVLGKFRAEALNQGLIF